MWVEVHSCARDKCITFEELSEKRGRKNLTVYRTGMHDYAEQCNVVADLFEEPLNCSYN